MNLRNLVGRVPLPPGGWIAAAIAAVMILGIVFFLVLAWDASRRAAGEARVGAAMGEARGKSAAEAVETVAAGAARDAATDDITRENADAIHRAPGADQAVHPDVHRAGLASLCRRAAYRGSEQCVQLLGPAELPDARPRR
jgi:hypothetical protein